MQYVQAPDWCPIRGDGVVPLHMDEVLGCILGLSINISMDISSCLLGGGFMDKIRVLAQGVDPDFPMGVARGG